MLEIPSYTGMIRDRPSDHGWQNGMEARNVVWSSIPHHGKDGYFIMYN